MLESLVRHWEESYHSRKLTAISLIYRWHHWEFESVWKCLKSHSPCNVENSRKHIWKGLLLAQVGSMGISIEQYRSRIGSHDNFVKTKDILSRLKDHFWSVMLMMFYRFKGDDVLFKVYVLFNKRCIGQKQNKEQRSHLHLGQKGKTRGCYCLFYTEHEPNPISVSRTTRSYFSERNSVSFPERYSVWERLEVWYLVYEKSRGEGDLCWCAALWFA